MNAAARIDHDRTPPTVTSLADSVTSPVARRYRIVSGLRAHPVPRLNMCLVRSPGAQTVHTLSRSAWRLLELCALGDEQRIHAIFANGSKKHGRAASERFERVLGELVARRLVVLDDGEALL